MSTLTPRKQVLFLHVKGANYIASIQKKANVAEPVLPPVIGHGWNKDGSLIWTLEIFSEKVEEIIQDKEIHSNDYIADSGESENEEDI